MSCGTPSTDVRQTNQSMRGLLFIYAPPLMLIAASPFASVIRKVRGLPLGTGARCLSRHLHALSVGRCNRRHGQGPPRRRSPRRGARRNWHRRFSRSPWRAWLRMSRLLRSRSGGEGAVTSATHAVSLIALNGPIATPWARGTRTRMCRPSLDAGERGVDSLLEMSSVVGYEPLG